MIWHRELHPIKEGKRKNRFATTCFGGLPLYGKAKHQRDCLLKDKRGNTWAGVQNGRLWWVKDYAWNGCTPKIYIGYPPVGKWVGTPDPPKSRRGSLGHDILYQFSSVLDISFEDANYNFLKWLETDGFWLAEQYYDAVEMFGEKFWKKNPESVTIEYV